MKKPIPLLLFSFFTSLLFATHNKAGEITYRQIGDQQIEAIITTYTSLTAVAADQDSLDLCWGDGQCESVLRVNGEGEIIAEGIKKNLYIANHTYAALGNYSLTVDDPNRNGGILNVNFPNSENALFSLRTEAYLLGPGSANFNHSPILLQAPIDVAFTGVPFMHSPNAFDADGDSLVYELIAPIGVANYTEVTGVSPGSGNTLSLDSETGLLLWDAPQQAGLYVITFSIKSYRNDELVGEVVRDMMIDVVSFLFAAPEITISGITNNGTIISVTEGDTVRLDIESIDPEPGNSVYLSATSGLFDFFSSAATFTSVTDGNMATATFEWIVQAEHLREAPYQLVIKTENDLPDHPASQLAVVRFRTVDYVSNLTIDLQPPTLHLLPNLVKDGQLQIYYDGDDFERSAYTIINSNGQVLKSGFLFTGRTDLNLQGLSAGVYYFNTRIKGQAISKAFVIGR